MELSTLTAISPLDGRYRKKVAALAEYFSEYALIKYRLKSEIEYFIALHKVRETEMGEISEENVQSLRELYLNFKEEDALRVKEIEAKTNHDVKAVEYFLKEKLESEEFKELLPQKEWIHFGLTSQDVNNTAIPMMLRDALRNEYLPNLVYLTDMLELSAKEWKKIPMLARTHGQPASPTTLGKEMLVFVTRLRYQYEELLRKHVPAKFGGATGNLNAHYIAFPNVNWDAFATSFVEGTLGLSRSRPTTQIDHYDRLADIFDNIKRINTILIDLCQDIWLYISSDYFGQKVVAGEVGSSAMPHKVNPIDFENAEGNSGLAIAVIEFLSRKLPVSRLQRDLTDSTILRNIGLAVGYSLLAIKSVSRGWGKLTVNPDRIGADLQKNSIVLSEAIQTVLRREKYEAPYELLKELTRGNTEIRLADLHEFIQKLDIPEKVKEELLQLRPENYIGNAGV